MEIDMYDKVILKTGQTAYIVEIYKNGEAYEADIDMPDGSIFTDTIWPKDIERVVKVNEDD